MIIMKVFISIYLFIICIRHWYKLCNLQVNCSIIIILDKDDKSAKKKKWNVVVTGSYSRDYQQTLTFGPKDAEKLTLEYFSRILWFVSFTSYVPSHRYKRKWTKREPCLRNRSHYRLPIYLYNIYISILYWWLEIYCMINVLSFWSPCKENEQWVVNLLIYIRLYSVHKSGRTRKFEQSSLNRKIWHLFCVHAFFFCKCTVTHIYVCICFVNARSLYT